MSRHSVLLVEDDPVSAHYLEHLLQALALAVTRVASLAEAEALLGASPARFALAVVDQNLAGDRGDRLPAVAPRVPMLAISAELSAAESARLLRAGFVACLRKPLDAASLSSALASAGLQVPLWDDERGLSVAAGDPGVLEGLRALLRRELPLRRAALHSALLREDIDAARRELHTLLGGCRLTGAVRLEHAAQALTAALDGKEWQAAWQTLDEAMQASR